LGKYYAFFITSFKNIQVYKLDVLLKVVSSFVLVIALREVWIAIYGSSGGELSNSGVSMEDMATYAMLSVVVRALLAPDLGWEIGWKVQQGDIILDLHKPWSFQWMHLSGSLGNSLFGIIYIVVPLFISIIIFFPISFPSGWQSAAFLLSLLFAFLISFAVNFMIGLLAFYFTEVWGFEFLKSAIVEICSGSFIPLWLFPHMLAQILQWLPFQGIYYIPLSLFIGKITGADILYSLVFQAVWAVLLLGLCNFVLHKAQKLLITTGG
jgi:ABC-2 type transport system permease protein